MRGFSAFINRPIMAIALNTIMFIVGLVAFNRLELRQEPDKKTAQLQIWTHYSGAYAKAIERQVTRPIEDALSGLSGLVQISSISRDSDSIITLKFKDNYPIDKALNQVRDRVTDVQNGLPEGVLRSAIYEMISDTYLTYLMIKDKTRSAVALSDFIKQAIVPELQLIDGVAQVEGRGLSQYQVEVSLDPIKLHQQKVAIGKIIHALTKERPFGSGGELSIGKKHKTIVLTAPIKHIEDLGQLRISSSNNQLIPLSEVSMIQIVQQPASIDAYLGTEPMQVLSITAKPSANPFEVMRAIRAYVQTKQAALPDSTSLEIMLDKTKTFKSAITSVYRALFEAVILVIIIVRITLGSFRAAFIPLVTVPLCLMGSFTGLLYLDFSLNPMTLLALVLAVGLVVDDAIVVVENIVRHLEQGAKNAVDAARMSLSEIGFSVIAMTVTLSAVYLPVSFQTDPSAILFKEFAWTLASCVLLSGFVALTLTPALCGVLLKPKNKQVVEKRSSLQVFYYQSLNWTLRFRKSSALILLSLCGFSYYLLTIFPDEHMPIEDTDIIHGQIATRNEAQEDLKNQWRHELDACASSVPEKVHLFQIQSHQGLYWQLLLSPRQERERSVFEIQKELNVCFDKIVGPLISSYAGSSSTNQDDSLKLILSTSGDYERLTDVSLSLSETLTALRLPYVSNIEGGEAQRIRRLQVDVDRAGAAHQGVSLNALEEVIKTYFTGTRSGTFYFGTTDYPIMVRANELARSDIEHINDFFIQNETGQSLPIGGFVSIKEQLTQSAYRHYNRLPAITLRIHLKPGTHHARALDELKDIIKSHLSSEIQFRFGGSVETFRESRASLKLTFLLAITFIYFVLAALFESIALPFIVLLTIPLSLVGALSLVWVMSGSNNVFTQIGLITLIGLITKHGILLCDSANREERLGASPLQAILTAAERRVRPILMTAIAMIFGAVPLLFSLGALGMARQHIAWIIIGGMTSGTLLSLYLIPSVYLSVALLRTKVMQS